MNIYYARELEDWVLYNNKPQTFGGLKKPILPAAKSDYHLPFKLQLKDQQIGPLIGIMTSPKNDQSLVGNRRLFINLQKELSKRNSLSFVFSYKNVNKDGSIIGYIYLPNQDGWLHASMPFPDIVYNRVPFRSCENSLPYLGALLLLQQNQIPLFNPRFIDKYELFQVLRNRLNKYLPETILIESKESLATFFNLYKDLYIKPCNLSKGKNIYRLHGECNQLVLHSQDRKQHYSGFDQVWDEYGDIFDNHKFIAQRSIQPALIDGIRFDFRILAHWSESEQTYLVTGVGIRACEQQHLTTHLVNGGFIMAYEQVQTETHDRFFAFLVEKVGYALTDEFGFFGEFSIDAGLTNEGEYVLYEVNSKPMAFDEEEIERKRILHLCDLFIQKTGFTNLK